MNLGSGKQKQTWKHLPFTPLPRFIFTPDIPTCYFPHSPEQFSGDGGLVYLCHSFLFQCRLCTGHSPSGKSICIVTSVGFVMDICSSPWNISLSSSDLVFHSIVSCSFCFLFISCFYPFLNMFSNIFTHQATGLADGLGATSLADGLSCVPCGYVGASWHWLYSAWCSACV